MRKEETIERPFLERCAYPLDQLTVNDYYEVPIEHLYKAIYILQLVDECQEEVASLSAKLESYMMQLPEEEGKRVYANTLYYYPNGIMCNDARLDHQNFIIMLSPWESSYRPEEPKPAESIEETVSAKPKRTGKPRSARTHAINTLRNSYPLWWMQIKEREGKPYKAPDWKYHLTNLSKQYQSYMNSSVTVQQQIVKIDHGINIKFRTSSEFIISQFLKHTHNNSTFGEFFFLREDELDEFIAFAEKAATEWMGDKTWNGDDTLSNYVCGAIDDEFFPKIKQNRDRIYIKLNNCYVTRTEWSYSKHHIYDPEIKDYVWKENFAYRNIAANCGIFTELPPQLAAIEAGPIRTILEKLNLVSPESFEVKEVSVCLPELSPVRPFSLQA